MALLLSLSTKEVHQWISVGRSMQIFGAHSDDHHHHHNHHHHHHHHHQWQHWSCILFQLMHLLHFALKKTEINYFSECIENSLVYFMRISSKYELRCIILIILIDHCLSSFPKENKMAQCCVAISIYRKLRTQVRYITLWGFNVVLPQYIHYAECKQWWWPLVHFQVLSYPKNRSLRHFDFSNPKALSIVCRVTEWMLYLFCGTLKTRNGNRIQLKNKVFNTDRLSCVDMLICISERNIFEFKVPMK